MDALRWISRVTACAFIIITILVLRIVMRLTLVASVILGLGFLVSWAIGLGMGGLIRQELDKPPAEQPKIIIP